MTRVTDEVGEATGPRLPRLELPWADGPAAGHHGDHVVMASRLELRRWRDVPGFLMAALRLRSLFRRSPGAVALSLRAAPGRRTFWTLSAWEDRASLGAYAGHDVHAAVMERFRPLMAGSTFVDWDASGPDRPRWSEARERLGAVMRAASEREAAEAASCASPS